MAKHKDINRASALLEGTQGWHMINASYSTGKRKNKRGCMYYNKNYCTYLKCVCHGAGNCMSYHHR